MKTHLTATLKHGSLITALALLTGAAVTSLTAPAAANPLPQLSGWGVRGDASFMGTIIQRTDGGLSGTFTIVILHAGEPPVTCRYTQFTPLQVNGSTWIFDGTGTCWGQYGPFAVSNHFAFIDYGSPGAGNDYVDVNYYGPIGVSIPGGRFDDGDITYTP